MRDPSFSQVNPNIEVVGNAEDGQMALKQVEVRRPDLVLMDIQMPGMNGLVATERLLQRFPQTRVIIVTADDTAETRRASRGSGARGFVTKDRLFNDLLFEIQQVFKEREETRRAAGETTAQPR